jgi:hypothetical protein
MIVVSVLGSIAAIGVICCLLFYLAVYALPLFAGVTAGVWAYGTGAGWLGGIAVGAVAGLATLLAGHVLLALVRPLWLRLVIAAAFVAPAAIAGYHATHGIVKHTMPSETWQVVFSLAGAVVVGITAFARLATLAPPGRTERGARLRLFRRFRHNEITPPVRFSSPIGNSGG